ncbi:MAG: response regulator [Anaerolineales bacterium]|nr:response regulator [Anaerolineales bacterium]
MAEDKNIRILLIDDELPVVEALQKFLENLGYHIDIQTSSSSALSALETDTCTYNLVISDLTMPEIDGITLAERIHSMKPDLPILLMTGYGNQITENRLVQAGIKKVIAKPFRLREITDSIRSLLME